jgi:hypothetical protein
VLTLLSPAGEQVLEPQGGLLSGPLGPQVQAVLQMEANSLTPFALGLLLLPVLATLLAALCVRCRELPGEWGAGGFWVLGTGTILALYPAPRPSNGPHLCPIRCPGPLRAPGPSVPFLPHWPSLPQPPMTPIPQTGESDSPLHVPLCPHGEAGPRPLLTLYPSCLSPASLYPRSILIKPPSEYRGSPALLSYRVLGM